MNNYEDFMDFFPVVEVRNYTIGLVIMFASGKILQFSSLASHQGGWDFYYLLMS